MQPEHKMPPWLTAGGGIKKLMSRINLENSLKVHEISLAESHSM